MGQGQEEEPGLAWEISSPLGTLPLVYVLACLVVGLVGSLTDLVQNGSALSFPSAENLGGGVTLDRSYQAGECLRD